MPARLTYDISARYGPTVTDPTDDIARMLNTVREIRGIYDAARRIMATDDSDRQCPLADCRPGNDIVVMGSSELAQLLMQHGPCRRVSAHDLPARARHW
jgi:hypothetical protein